MVNKLLAASGFVAADLDVKNDVGTLAWRGVCVNQVGVLACMGAHSCMGVLAWQRWGWGGRTIMAKVGVYAANRGGIVIGILMMAIIIHFVTRRMDPRHHHMQIPCHMRFPTLIHTFHHRMEPRLS